MMDHQKPGVRGKEQVKWRWTCGGKPNGGGRTRGPRGPYRRHTWEGPADRGGQFYPRCPTCGALAVTGVSLKANKV